MKKLYGITVFNKNGFLVRQKKVKLAPEKSKKVFNALMRTDTGHIALLEGEPLEVEITEWSLGPHRGIHDQKIVHKVKVPLEDLWESYPYCSSWAQRIIACENEFGGVSY